MTEALLWDVDGTLAETEGDGHRVAFNLAFEEAGVPWRWDEVHYGALLRVAGGRERFLHDMASRPDAPHTAEERQALVLGLHRRKNEIHAALVSSGVIPLREGVAPLIEEASARGLRQGIVTTTSRPLAPWPRGRGCTGGRGGSPPHAVAPGRGGSPWMTSSSGGRGSEESHLTGDRHQEEGQGSRGEGRRQ